MRMYNDYYLIREEENTISEHGIIFPNSINSSNIGIVVESETKEDIGIKVMYEGIGLVVKKENNYVYKAVKKENIVCQMD